MHEWYKDLNKLSEAINLIQKYSCCFGINALLRIKNTPCCNYSEIKIPKGLEDAIIGYLDGLNRSQYIELNKILSYQVGETFFVRKHVVVRLLCRILVDFEPCSGKTLLIESLKSQIQARKSLLKELETCF